ncbi:unnamed protein product, partial [Linum tenue]
LTRPEREVGSARLSRGAQPVRPKGAAVESAHSLKRSTRPSGAQTLTRGAYDKGSQRVRRYGRGTI